jgi:tetratricopeptide (TPR) repeat protein
LLVLLTAFRLIRWKPKGGSHPAAFSHSVAFSQTAGHWGCLAAIMVAALFSNPFHVSPILLCLVFHIVMLCRYLVPVTNLTSKGWGLPEWVATAWIGWVLWYTLTQWHADNRWALAARKALYENFAEAKPDYEKAYPWLRHHSPFLLNYGAEAALAGEYAKARELLESAKEGCAVNNLYVYLGDVYAREGRYEQAEKSYLHAVFMVPSAIYPKYKLIELYRLSGQPRLARSWSVLLLEYPVKKRSEVSDQPLAEVRKNLAGMAAGGN